MSLVAFWLIAAALLAVVLVMVLAPLVAAAKRPDGKPPRNASRDENVEIYRSRYQQLREARERGDIDETELEEQAAELRRQAEEDLADTRHDARTHSGRPVIVLVLVALLIPTLSLPLYLHLGVPESVGMDPRPLRPATATSSGAAPASARPQQSPEEMVAGLEARLAAAPDDPQGWLMLARSYAVLGQHDDAVEAYATAHDLIGDDASLLVDWAEAESVRDGYRFGPESVERIDRALELDPRHPKGLMLGGMAALQAGDQALAEQRLRTVLAGLEPGSPQAQMVTELLGRMGLAVDGAASDPPAAPRGRQPADAARGPALAVQVSIEPALAAALSGNERVFVFARAPSGPPMPVAVAVLEAEALPATVRLDDGSSMMPERRLSDMTEVEVGARVSLSGSPVAGRGDLEGSAGVVPVDAGEVAVEVYIDTELE